MDSASLTSLTPLLDEIDKWVELAPLLPVLISLELVLSADNAVALASITKSLPSLEKQRKALNIGILIALFLRILLILMASVIISFWQIQLLGGIYLLFLSFSNIFSINTDNISSNIDNSVSTDSLLKIIFVLAVTDLAFSIDSVTAAVAISDQFLLVVTGAIIGVIALRFTSGLFIRWLDIYSRLEKAGYLAIGFIGLKLVSQVIFPSFVVPEYIIFLGMFLLFLWGFSRKISSQ